MVETRESFVCPNLSKSKDLHVMITAICLQALLQMQDIPSAVSAMQFYANVQPSIRYQKNVSGLGSVVSIFHPLGNTLCFCVVFETGIVRFVLIQFQAVQISYGNIQGKECLCPVLITSGTYNYGAEFSGPSG